MTTIKERYDYIEVKTYAGYSEVAKELGMTIDQVGTVYEWYLKKTIEDIIELPTVKVRLSGLGVLVFNPVKAMKLIAKKIKAEDYKTIELTEYLTPLRGYAHYYLIEEWFNMFDARYERGKSKKLYYEQLLTFLEGEIGRQRQNHKNLYESLQRVHGPEPEGAKELGQSLGRCGYKSS